MKPDEWPPKTKSTWSSTSCWGLASPTDRKGGLPAVPHRCQSRHTDRSRCDPVRASYSRCWRHPHRRLFGYFAIGREEDWHVPALPSWFPRPTVVGGLNCRLLGGRCQKSARQICPRRRHRRRAGCRLCRVFLVSDHNRGPNPSGLLGDRCWHRRRCQESAKMRPSLHRRGNGRPIRRSLLVPRGVLLRL